MGRSGRTRGAKEQGNRQSRTTQRGREVTGLCKSQGSNPGVHAPLPQWTSLIKHKLKDKIITNFKTAIRTALKPLERGPDSQHKTLSNCTGHLPLTLALLVLQQKSRSKSSLSLSIIKHACVYDRDGTLHRGEATREEVGGKVPHHLFNHPSHCIAKQSLLYLQRLLKLSHSNNNFNLSHRAKN